MERLIRGDSERFPGFSKSSPPLSDSRVFTDEEIRKNGHNRLKNVFNAA
jgi:hypothetical protein